MSKKKSFSGSTMTLKDFHGGSIPSVLPLPSAPGVSVRPPDRPGSWGPSAIGSKPDIHQHRSRPGSAGDGGGGTLLGSGFVDERGPPFLSTSAHIGRHFEEDERKPFDAASAPRRPPPLSDPVRPAPLVPASVSGNQRPQQQPKPQRPISSPSPVTHGPSVNLGTTVPAVPNAWGLRKEAAVQPVHVGPTPSSSVAILSSRFAQASAIQKVSSGRWQSKPVMPDAEAIRVQETADSSLDRRFGESVWGVDEAKARNLLGFYSDQERVRSPLQQEVERSMARPLSNEGRYGGGGSGPQLQQQQGMAVADVGERPKLKLLPRSKPMDGNETRTLDEKQGYQPPMDPVHIGNVPEMHGNMNMPRPVSAGADAGSRVIERSRLNLKPRSMPIEQSEKTTERERKTVFGGARPRELVLKERGVENIVTTNLEVTSPADRVKNDILKADMKIQSAAPTTRRGERSESFPMEQRSGRDLERKDYRSDLEKVDAQRTSWRNDNRRNTREAEKPVERHQELDTWRKPVEQPKPEVSGSGLRHGKAASALELAQAFSRSVSDTRPDNHFPSQMSLRGRPQVPFSRLTDTRDFYSGPGHRQINGY